ncbi:hypothetical protein ANANG_G00243990 [Anguilla anguilla]|uniref:Secreted protein n=1 Tax=Anguilla anguilla TaxID=7936 RepID=A0A9D3RM63_ANGAN|nr:hypothetical protein ANANG_G00243990 [Anguilla anguilla]
MLARGRAAALAGLTVLCFSGVKRARSRCRWTSASCSPLARTVRPANRMQMLHVHRRLPDRTARLPFRSWTGNALPIKTIPPSLRSEWGLLRRKLPLGTAPGRVSADIARIGSGLRG